MYSVISFAEHPDYLDQLMTLSRSIWVPKLPPSRSAYLYPRILRDFANYVLIIVDDTTHEPVGYAGGVPFVGPACLADLPDDGYDAVIEGAFNALDNHLAPTMFAALVIGIAPSRQRQGLGEVMTKALCNLARQSGFSDFVLPVRPTQKAREPRTSMANYIRKRREDGLPQDTWIRLHTRLGASIIKVCPASMTMRAPLSAWEEATGMTFAKSGLFEVAGGLAPLQVDLEKGEGVLIEPNVWMHFDLRRALI